MQVVPEGISSRVDICIWGNKYKDDKRKEATFKENNKNKYILILQHYPHNLHYVWRQWIHIMKLKLIKTWLS